MKFKENIFQNYLEKAPLPLVVERWYECELYKTKEFPHPILDIGCGEGMYAYILFDEKIDTGIDPNSKELEMAKELGAYDELLNCYGDKIPKEDKSYNTIFSNSVLEHIPKINDVLTEAHRLLADDGKMYITVPTDMFDKYSVVYQIISGLGLKNMAQKYTLFFNNFWAHYHYYDKQRWEELFNKNGFIVSDVQEYASKKVCLTNDFLAPFSIVSFVVKKFTNRWFLFPYFRKIIAKIFNILFLSTLQNSEKISSKGGLIFFELQKEK
jgi:ubiquinone/menaquinone biosynthesis C-methylase UbiE